MIICERLHINQYLSLLDQTCLRPQVDLFSVYINRLDQDRFATVYSRKILQSLSITYGETVLLPSMEYDPQTDALLGEQTYQEKDRLKRSELSALKKTLFRKPSRELDFGKIYTDSCPSRSLSRARL